MTTKPLRKKATALFAAGAVALGLLAQMPALSAWAEDPVHSGTIDLASLTAPLVLDGDDGDVTLTGALDSDAIIWGSSAKALITVEKSYNNVITLRDVTIDTSAATEKRGIYMASVAGVGTVQIVLAGENSIKSDGDALSIHDADFILSGNGTLAVESVQGTAIKVGAGGYSTGITANGNLILDGAQITKAKGKDSGIYVYKTLTLQGSASISDVEADDGAIVVGPSHSGVLLMSGTSRIAGVKSLTGNGIAMSDRLEMKDDASIYDVEVSTAEYDSSSESFSGIRSESLVMEDNASIRKVRGGVYSGSLSSATKYSTNGCGVYTDTLSVSGNASITDVHHGSGVITTGVDLCVTDRGILSGGSVEPIPLDRYGEPVEVLFEDGGEQAIQVPVSVTPARAGGYSLTATADVVTHHAATGADGKAWIWVPKPADGQRAYTLTVSDGSEQKTASFTVNAAATAPISLVSVQMSDSGPVVTVPSAPSTPSVPPVVVAADTASGSTSGAKIELKASQLPSGVEASDVTFSAKTQEDASAPVQAAEATLASIPGLPAAKAIAVYDLDLLLKSSGKKVDFTGKITVSIPMPAGFGKYLRVFHVADDGTMTEVPAVINGSSIVLTLEHFSYYAIVDFASPAGKLPAKLTATGNPATTTAASDSVTANPKTGATAVSVAGILLMLAGAGALLVSKKTKKEM